jgi:ABC-type multidrug transport system fused ATPase/permease subunit
MYQTFKKTLSLLSKQEKKRGLLVLMMVIIMAVFETLGVASIMPFLTVLGNPEAIETNPYLNTIYSYFNFQSKQQFLIALGVFAFSLVVFSAAFRIATTYVINRYTQMRLHTLSERLLETYLRQPYSFFLGRNTGDMAKSILSEVNQLISNVLKPAMDGIAYIFVTIALISFLIINDPKLALIVGATIGGSYLVIFLMIQKYIKKLGSQRLIANKTRFRTAAEALGGIKDIKLLGREHTYLMRFSPASKIYSINQATANTLSVIPRYILEAIGFGGIVLLALALMAQSDNFGDALPLLGLYAFAGYKLLPAAQQIYTSLTKVRFGGAAVDDVYEDLHTRDTLVEIQKVAVQPLSVNHSIRFQNLSFFYENAEKPALKNLNFDIKKGSSIGLVGSTGAGKTTLVDLILGLLIPTEGEFKVDNTNIDEKNIRQWQKSLGYVPQDIYLVDASISENIALGIPVEKIDQSQVEKCAELAQVHDFILEELAHGYQTQVGERGVRLSGGQRQRIGIARALYHDPEVLVFDEATSALDNVTEKAVIEAVNILSHKKTIIMIAHRLSTVKNCDQIIYLEQGEIIDSGNYQELIERNPKFRNMAI